jgi:uncharacterized protein YndB with AHSA1/START domain
MSADEVDGMVGTSDGGEAQVRFERRLPHPPAKVWRAITEPEHLAAWFPTTVEGERAAGAPLTFRFEDMPDEPAMRGEVVVWDPPHVFELAWAEDRLRFELRPDPSGEGCVLTLTDTFDDPGKAARDATGWHVCLEALASALSDGAVPPPAEDRWKDLHPSYVEAFGEQHATVGPPDHLEAE